MIFTGDTSTQSSEFFAIKTLNSALSAPFDKLGQALGGEWERDLFQSDQHDEEKETDNYFKGNSSFSVCSCEEVTSDEWRGTREIAESSDFPLDTRPSTLAPPSSNEGSSRK